MIMKQKPIIIWWGVNTSYSFLEEGLRAEEPVPILKKFLTECATTDVKKKGYINPSGQVGSASDLAHCPAIIDELKNVYGIKSYYDYKLNIDSQNAISTEDYGQDFFNKHITVRSERLHSFKQGWLFFAPYEKNLLMSQQHPFLEDNDVANNTIIIPGQFDCARYFRDLEFAFIFKKKTFKENNNRIGKNPYFYTFPPIEDIEINIKKGEGGMMDELRDKMRIIANKSLGEIINSSEYYNELYHNEN